MIKINLIKLNNEYVFKNFKKFIFKVKMKTLKIKLFYLIACGALFVFLLFKLISMLFVQETLLQFEPVDQQKHRKFVFCIVNNHKKHQEGANN